MAKNIKIIGITVSITFFYMLVILIFFKAISVLLNPFFINNAFWLAIVTGALLLIGAISGGIALGTMFSKILR